MQTKTPTTPEHGSGKPRPPRRHPGLRADLPLWHGRPQTARRFGVSRHTLWRFMEQGHLGRSLPKAMDNTVGDDRSTIAVAGRAVTTSRLIQGRAAGSRPLAETVEGRPEVPVRRASTDSWPVTTAFPGCYAGGMAFSRERILVPKPIRIGSK